MQQLAMNFEQQQVNPLDGVELSELERFIAALLLEATAAQPMACGVILDRVQERFNRRIVERHVKEIVRKLRKTHGFPILARRTKPFGYWWYGSIEEMTEFVEVFRAQAMDELHTLGQMVRRHYPALAGQLSLNDLEMNKSEN